MRVLHCTSLPIVVCSLLGTLDNVQTKPKLTTKPGLACAMFFAKHCDEIHHKEVMFQELATSQTIIKAYRCKLNYPIQLSGIEA